MRINGEGRSWYLSVVALGYFLYAGECISIDNRLTIVKSDCYERIAIGQRIDEKNVSRKTDSKTFTECQMECTIDGEKCRTFSYGVGVKGNTTCEISSAIIKETTSGNLEGTTDDTDYDLYVKKVDCKFALDVQPDIDAIDTGLRPSTTLQTHPTSEEEAHHQSLATTSAIPLPFNAGYKTKRRPDAYKKQHDYSEMEHRLGSNRKQDDGFYDETNFDGYAGAVSYNKYEKPERLDDKDKEDDLKSYGQSDDGYNKRKYSNKVPFGYIGSNGPPRGYGYSNTPENKPKPVSLDYSPNSDKYYTSSFGYDKNNLPFRPSHLSKPYSDQHDRPSGEGYDTPPTSLTTTNPGYHYGKPTHSNGFDTNFQDPDNPNYPSGSQKPYESSHFDPSASGYPLVRPQPFGGNAYGSSNQRPYFSSVRPVMEHSSDYTMHSKRPNFGFLGGLYELNNGEYRPYGSSGNSLGNVYSPKYPHQKPSLDEEFRPHEGLVTSYVTEIRNVCFRRILAGKRVSRAFVRKIVSCERVEDCQQECSEEKKFVCEGFNYRLDPSGRGRGDCELIDLPFVLLDPHKDIITNPNYDYYEKDRNTYQRCKEGDMSYKPSQSYPPSSSGWQQDQSTYGYGGSHRETHRYDGYPHRDPPRPGFVFKLQPADDYRPYNRRSDVGYTYTRGEHPRPIKPDPHRNGYDYHTYTYPQFTKDYDHKTYLPPSNTLDHNDYNDKQGFWNHYDYDYNAYGKGKPHHAVLHYDGKHGGQHTNYLPLPFDGQRKNWGEYGGVYGNGDFIPQRPGYLPPSPKDHLGIKPATTSYGQTYINECSLRSATGYRLYKKIVKKILTVPTIYDCEMACFKETDFVCTSYAFRYIVGSGIPPNNCYLSDRNYKELDYYTDLEQDRNFDIYTMNNKEMCMGFVPHQKDSSECFLHVRSGQRIDDRCVRDSLFVKSFLDCQLECLRSQRFLCRSFSFRYGSAIIGSTAENCQLSDVPYRELDPYKDLVPDPGFVIYERASYGYGCELDHDQYIPRKAHISPEPDKMCYLSYGWPAKLLPSAVRKALRVPSEEACRRECTRARMETPFCCMSFSYSSIPIKNGINCFLSDIYQRDLLETIDFTKDPDCWLFSWDVSNAQCRLPNYFEQKVPFADRHDLSLGTITWRIYSVGGWPCKRGTLCRQSELGFWFCELEGGSPSSWDYCCRPGHQCGYSEGYPYEWCYVGPSYTQWRKCSDKYYPYLPSPHFHIPSLPKPSTTYLPHDDITSTPFQPDHHTRPPIPTTDYQTFPPSTSSDIHPPKPTIFLEEPTRTYLPPSQREPRPWHTRPDLRIGFRPDRPKAPPPELVPKPSLNEYEDQFDNLFLDPPKPGMFGQARHWPVSYLHKEGPPNASLPMDHRFEQMKETREKKLEPKYEAIKNLIDVIKNDDLDDIKYQITNDSNKPDDVLHVQIPLPSNFTKVLEKDKVDDKLDKEVLLPPKVEKVNKEEGVSTNDTAKEKIDKNLPVYRRSYIVKTNATDAKRWRFPENLFGTIK